MEELDQLEAKLNARLENFCQYEKEVSIIEGICNSDPIWLLQVDTCV